MASLLLVEDHTLFRAGIRALIEHSSSCHRIVGEAADGLSASRLARQLLPDITLMDVTMPALNGIETAGLLAKECPHTRVVILSMHADPAYVYAALDAGGAFAYVLKDAAFAELGNRDPHRSRRPEIPERGRSPSPSKWPSAIRPHASLLLTRTFHGRRPGAFSLWARCMHSSAEIATELGLSVRTIETYRQNLMDKLDLHSAAALTAFAIQSGVSSPRPRGGGDPPQPAP